MTYLLVVMLASSASTVESSAGSVVDSSLVVSVSVRFVLLTAGWRGRGIVFVLDASLMYLIHLESNR